MPRPSLLAVLLLALGPASVAQAADDLTTTVPETQIYGGSETEQCAWPSVVYLSTPGAACTGALVHPQIVLTAAHCVPNDVTATVRFGERANTAVQLADTEFCRANPGFNDTGGGDDYGFCKLATPVTNIPVTPIAFGCEEGILGPGTAITHVGYGNDENGDSGRKKSVNLTVQSVTQSGEIISGSGGDGICSGDSGGPVMTKLRSNLGGDDTWRVIGIHSWAQMANPGECGGQAGSVIAWRAVDFIEQESGIDVTPCFTSGGSWDPTWSCQGFPIDPGTGGEGSYNAMCETGPLASFSEVCGPPLSDFPDEDPPSLVVLSPEGNEELEVDGNDFADVHIEAEADDGDGWGIAQVELVVAPEDGSEMVTEVITFAPYRWNTQFPVGAYNLKLIATDNAGNQTDSGWIGVGVGVKAPENPPDDDTGGDESGGDGTSEDGGTEDGSDPDEDQPDDDDDDDDDDDADGTESGAPARGEAEPAGCGCASTAPGDRGVALLTFVALGFAFRRRRA